MRRCWKDEIFCPSPTRSANWRNSSASASTLLRSRIDPLPLPRNLCVRLTHVKRQALRPALMPVNELRVIESHQPQNGGVEVVDVETIPYCAQAELVGFTDDLPSLYTAS